MTSENGFKPFFAGFPVSLSHMGQSSVSVEVDEVVMALKRRLDKFCCIWFGVGQAASVVVKLGFANNSLCASVTELISGQWAWSCLAEMRASSLGSILSKQPP